MGSFAKILRDIRAMNQVSGIVIIVGLSFVTLLTLPLAAPGSAKKRPAGTPSVGTAATVSGDLRNGTPCP